MSRDISDAAPPVAGALALGGDAHAIVDYYRDWAARFDADVTAEGYHAPAVLAGWLAALIPAYGVAKPDRLSMLDAGCGTGLLGRALAPLGIGRLIGADISQAMVDEAARAECYDALHGEIDLNQPLTDDLAGPFDVILAAGVFTQGHVPPTALDRLAAATRPGGLILISVRDGYREIYDLAAHLAEAAAAGRYHVVARLDAAAYVGPDTADYLALRVA